MTVKKFWYAAVGMILLIFISIGAAVGTMGVSLIRSEFRAEQWKENGRVDVAGEGRTATYRVTSPDGEVLCGSMYETFTENCPGDDAVQWRATSITPNGLLSGAVEIGVRGQKIYACLLAKKVKGHVSIKGGVCM